MSKQLYTLFFLIVGISTMTGQQGNPFDLKFRKNLITQDSAGTSTQTIVQEKKVTAVAPSKTPTTASNPFDLTPKLVEREISSPVRTRKQTRDFFMGDAKHFLTGKTAFWILMFMSLLLAVIVNLNRSLIGNLIKAWTNPNFSNFLLRNKKGPDQLLYNLLSVLFYTNFCMFIVQAAHLYYGMAFSLKLTGWVLLAVFCVYLVRHFVLALLSSLFSIHKEAAQFSFTINIFNILLGLVLLVVNFILAYAPYGTGIFFIYIALGLIAIQYLYRTFRGVMIGSSFLSDSKMHFFLYLCTCEIAPLMIMISVIRNLG